ncbi:variable surface protein [Plasmodium gonderi]|uniref:Variable surface protein n=1 Tax=Plasmodium gonderi TaxID=77519 RepID=A0A1Y1JNZ3_PLAGO|nr:variable surface protein [Plasmodium gonderi]GAW84296.1 variable surface protein [Plasmodium gonderi]
MIYILYILHYNLVKYFPSCEAEIEKYRVINNALHKCIHKNPSKTHHDVMYSSIQDCTQVMSYISYIHNKEGENKSTDADCLFLYYWLYKYLENLNKSSSTGKYYKTSIMATGYSDANICKDFQYKNITDSDIKMLTVLYNMYNSLEYIKKYDCESKEYNDFCAEYNDIKDKYVPPKEIQIFTTIEKEQLLISNNNIAVIIVITVVLTLVVLILLFILYKLTPFGSYLLNRIERIKSTLNNLDNKRAHVYQPEIANIISNNRDYNVLYNLDAFYH